MNAEVYKLYGLRGLNLARFQTAGAIIAANLARVDPEDALRRMREHLAAARQEPTWERGQAQVACAANALSVAIRIQERT